MKNNEAWIVVDYQNTFIPVNEWGTWELWVPWGWEIVHYINSKTHDIVSAWWIIVKTRDYHSLWHMSLASSFKWKYPITTALWKWENPNPSTHPECFLTYEEVLSWGWSTSFYSEGVHFDYENLLDYMKEVRVQAMWPDHAIQWNESSEIFSELERRESDIEIFKWYELERECYSWFWWRELIDVDGKIIEGKTMKEVLMENEIKVLHILWLATDYCVTATAIDWIKEWFWVKLHTKWIAWVTLDWSKLAIEEMKDMWVEIVE